MIPRSMYRYTGLILACAVALVLLTVPSQTIVDWPTVAFLMALTFVTENFGLQLPVAGSVSLSFAVTYAAMLYAGPLAAILSAVAGSTTIAEYREGKPAVLRLFNVAQLTLAAGIAGFSYQIVGGAALEGTHGLPAFGLVAALVAPVVFFSLNVLLVAYAASLLTGDRLGHVLSGQGFLSHGFSLVVLALLGLMVTTLLVVHSWLGLTLLVLPFMAARRTFRVYSELTEAYTSTVRSLVTAIEAKDPYTRGHSERVAVYASRLARRMSLPRPELELLERAALLHDVGKIGIDIDTLTSPTQLSAEEVRTIRQHPVLGSQLLANVEFLADVVPIVRHHHERLDGAGYPDGLIGSSIPVLARVLSIADAYDAMTSDRAYRIGMSQTTAIGEIARVAGTQLDRAMAEQFVTMLLEDSHNAESG